MRVRVYACAPHFAEVSKMAQDAPRSEGTQAPGRPPQAPGAGATTTTGTQATTTRAPRPEHQRTRNQYEKEN